MDESFFAQAFEKSAVGMAFVEANGKVLSANPALLKILRKDIWMVVGFPLDEHLGPEDALRWTRFYQEFADGRARDYYFESPFRPQEDREAWWSIQLSDIGMEWGGQKIYYAVIQDITLKKVGEQKLREARLQAETASQAKSQFLANMSHEIRTPLFTITGMVDLLVTSGLKGEQAHHARQITQAAQVLLDLVNDVLDFSKIESGHLALEHIPFDLDDVAAQSLEVVILGAYRKKLELILDLDTSVPRFWVGDPGRLRQVLVNLLNNAVKFTAHGHVVLKIRHQEIDPGGQETLIIHIEDTGIGINDQARENLFQAFAQGDSSTTRQFGGTGLGLVICQKLVRMLGGEIGYHSTEGQGTEFFFTVKLQRNQDPELAWGAQGGGREILVVDDHPYSLEILTYALRQAGFRVRQASDSHEALSILLRHAETKGSVAAVLIDQELGSEDGWELARKIREEHLLGDPALILLSVLRKTFEPSPRYRRNLFHAVIDKPANPRHLVEVLVQGLAGRWPEPANEDLAPPKMIHDPADPVKNRLKVLVAEDNEVNRELFQMLLHRLGCKVALAENGRAAVELYPAFRPDMIFMDLQMPELNGYQASVQLRKMKVGAPIVAVTASAVKGELERCLKAGMNGILTKPFKLEDLRNVMGKFLPHFEKDLARTSDVPDNWIGPTVDPALHRHDPVEPDAPDFSLEEAKKVFLGNQELILSLIRRFLPRTKEGLKELSRALEVGDLDKARQAAHAIKGSALNLTAKPLGNAAAVLEAAARDQRLGDCSLAFPALEEAYRKFEAAVLPLIR